MRDEHHILLQEYEQYLNIKEYKPRGIEVKLLQAGCFLEYMRSQYYTFSDLTIADCTDYRTFLHLQKNTNGTNRYCSNSINGILSVLRTFFAFLVVKKKIPSNFFLYVENARESRSLPQTILSSEQIETLLFSLKIKDTKSVTLFLALILLYSTGMRINELALLETKDINCDEGYITIRDDKERQDRKAVLPEFAQKLLSFYLQTVHDKTTPALFTYRKPRSFARWVFDNVKKLCTQQNLPFIGCHGFRHSIATHLLQKGADLREVQEFLGHKRIQNTEIYIHIAIEDLQDVVNRFHPREKEAKAYETT